MTIFFIFVRVAMELARRLVRAINWIYILYAVAAVSLLYAFTTPVVIDPLIAFLLAGIVPGTDIVLSPETMLLILTDIFGVGLCVMLIIWLVQRRLMTDIDYEQVVHESSQAVDYDGSVSRVLRHVVAAAAIQKTAKLSTKAAQAQVGGTVSLVMRHSSTRAVDTPVRRVMTNLFSAAITAISGVFLIITTFAASAAQLVARCARLVLYLLVEGLYQVSVFLAKALRLAGRGITWSFVFCIVLLGTIIDWVIRISAYTWTKSKPGLRRFDRWLELRYRDVGNFVLKQLRRNEILMVIAAVVRTSITDLRRLFIK